MKIALLSFHNAANYGAALQAYALQKVLESKGHESPYIDYQNAMRRHAYSMPYQIVSSLKKGQLKSSIAYIIGFPFMYLRKVRFDKFYQRNLAVTPKTYKSSEEASELNGQYDKFIVGSDQVWNPHNNGRDFAFMLDFVKDDSKKISYSSSFGITQIPSDLVDKYRTNPQKFKHIAVRESIGVKLVKEVSGRDAKLVLDPVMLMTKEDWLKIVEPIDEKFVFTYTNRDNQFEKFLKQTGYQYEGKQYKLARATKFGDFLSSKVRVKFCMSPSDFVSSIYSADLIFTASFHCVAISIVLNKPFVVILTRNAGKDERLLNLLELLGLEDRILSEKMTADDVNRVIDYKEVNRKLEKLRKDSLDYLLNSLAD